MSDPGEAGTSKLLEAIERGRRSGNDLVDELLGLGEHPVGTVAEAEAICAALNELDRPPDALPCGLEAPPAGDERPATPLTLLTALFQRVSGAEAFGVLRERGLPLLVGLYRARLGAHGRHREDLLFLLKVFASYQDEEGCAEVAAAARRGLWADDTLWETIFQQFDDEHPHRAQLLERLRSPLPRGFAAVAYLDFVNGLALAGEVTEHPFDSAEGKDLLEGWLTEADPLRASYAHSAAACLPFVSRPERDRLLALALDHSDQRVQIEAAWASATLGSEGGVKLLRHYCLDPRFSGVARAYLAEVGREHDIPPEALEPALVAQSELCLWLAHPDALGRPPDAVRIRDARRMYWPPTRDERSLWLIEYRYASRRPDAEDTVGLGLAGSITASLLGEVTAETAPDDAYALHCCFELEVNEDPRAPAERTVEAGRLLLAVSPSA